MLNALNMHKNAALLLCVLVVSCSEHPLPGTGVMRTEHYNEEFCEK